MPPPASPALPTSAAREKQWVALASLLAAVLLTGLKLVVGVWTNSLGILSEAAHSGLDLVAAALTLWAVRIADKPADSEHPYGHGKFENLSALFETLLLLLTCAWIIYEAIRRMAQGGVDVEHSVWAFVVVVVSIAVDFTRARSLQRAADKYHSQALEADALHFSTDVWSSCVVLLGLAGVWLAERWQMPWLAQADSLAALGVALIVVGVSLQLGRRATDALLDAIPRELPQRVRAAAAAAPGVSAVEQVRLRRSGASYFVDVSLAVKRDLALERAHEIANRAEDAIRAVLPGADVVVHVEPIVAASEDLATTIGVLAARHELGAHSIRLYDEPGGRAVDLHLEVDSHLQLDEAHRQASEFERELHATVPDLTRIVTHIEPAGASRALPAEPAARGRVQSAAAEFLSLESVPSRLLETRAQWVEGELSVTLRLTLGATTPITVAHDLTRRLEEHLRRRVGHLGRVMIHVEPSASGPG